MFREKKRHLFCAGVIVLLAALPAGSTIFGSIRGVVHDPQHRPVAAASVKLKSATSDWTQTAQTDQEGAFAFSAVPLGDYLVTVSKSGFADDQQTVTVISNAAPMLHCQLKLPTVNETATVTGEAPENVATIDTVTPTTLVTRADITATPGADRSNGLEMITDYVPATYVTHDMLHMLGGHQVSWLIDGVPIPNTNIAANLGPVIDPKDIDYLEAQRGSYQSAYGDRTYGIFNVVPRTGFAHNRECDLYYGSGFTNGIQDAQYSGPYLPSHTSVDLSLGNTFAEKYTVSVSALNVANRRVDLDNSLTLGGFHKEPSQSDLCGGEA